MSRKCCICLSTTNLDDHHIDCNEGKLSPETVPLCRRCHRTYHDRGLKWFEDEFLDKTIELENRRREIVNSKKLTPPYQGISVPYGLCDISPLPPVDKAEVIASRSDYWYKKHGLTKPRTVSKARVKVMAEREMRNGNSSGYLGRLLKYQACMEPLCGKEWLAGELARVGTKLYDQSMTIMYDGRVIGEFSLSTKRGEIRQTMKAKSKERG